MTKSLKELNNKLIILKKEKTNYENKINQLNSIIREKDMEIKKLKDNLNSKNNIGNKF